MKKTPIIVLLFLLAGCISHSQKRFGKIEVDKNLDNIFSNGPMKGVQGGPKAVYVNGKLVYSTDSSSSVELLFNADIRDINGKHMPLDTCTCYLVKDTLSFLFTESLRGVPDSIRIKILKDELALDFIPFTSKGKYEATFEFLKLNNEPLSKGQSILGEIAFKIFLIDKNIRYAFKGPFTCIIE